MTPSQTELAIKFSDNEVLLKCNFVFGNIPWKRPVFKLVPVPKRWWQKRRYLIEGDYVKIGPPMSMAEAAEMLGWMTL